MTYELNRAYEATFRNRRETRTGLVEVCHVEDRGDYWYVTWAPVHWLNGARVEGSDMLGRFGCARVEKTPGQWTPTFVPTSAVVKDQPSYGLGVRAAWGAR